MTDDDLKAIEELAADFVPDEFDVEPLMDEERLALGALSLVAEVRRLRARVSDLEDGIVQHGCDQDGAEDDADRALYRLSGRFEEWELKPTDWKAHLESREGQ